jgi:hypothetical protein
MKHVTPEAGYRECDEAVNLKVRENEPDAVSSHNTKCKLTYLY